MPDAALLTLPSYVHACRTQDSVILLDLRHDRYFALGGAQAEALEGTVAGWPPIEAQFKAEIGPTAATAAAVAKRLLKEGLLAESTGGVTASSPPLLDLRKLTTAGGIDINPRVRVRLADCVRFTAACLRAAAELRWRSLEAVVASVERRKQLALAREQAPAVSEIVELVSVFRTLKTLAFTSHGHCLYHSLALLHFLAYYGAYPAWVLGVRTTPWRAHSWTQWEGVVLDDSPTNVRCFTPILSV